MGLKKTKAEPIAGKGRYVPLSLVLAYLVITMTLNLIGPITYFEYNKTIVVGFMGLVIVTFAAGYVHSVLFAPTPSRTGKGTLANRGSSFLKTGIVVATLIILSVFFERLVYYGVNFSIFELIFNLGLTYQLALQREVDDVLVSVRVATLLAPILKVTLILGIYHFQRLGWAYKSLFVTLLLTMIVDNLLFFGTQKIYGDLLIFWVSSLLIKDYRHLSRNTVKVITGLIVAGSLFFGYFQYARLSASSWAFPSNSLMEIDTQGWLFGALGFELASVIVILLLYFTMGYYGLSLCLQMPFEWTYGIGNSFALVSYVEQYFGIDDIFYNTYPLRMEWATGWPALMYWQTAFPWLASDLTFPGTILFMGGVGWIYARCWLECVRYENPVSIVLFAQLNIMLLFLPSNNQLMQTRESLISTVIIVTYWLLFHERYNR